MYLPLNVPGVAVAGMITVDLSLLDLQNISRRQPLDHDRYVVKLKLDVAITQREPHKLQYIIRVDGLGVGESSLPLRGFGLRIGGG